MAVRIIIFLIIVAQPVFAQDLPTNLFADRAVLPSDVDRIRGQRLFLEGIIGQSTTELFAGKLSTNNEWTEAEISLNIHRLLKRNSDMFIGYRSIPRAWRNLQFSISAPINTFPSENFGFGLTWAYNHAHRWDEKWDAYFPKIPWPKDLNEVTATWTEEQLRKLRKASVLVDSMLITEGINGISLSFAAAKHYSQWEEVSFSLIASRYYRGVYLTFNMAGGRFLDNLDETGLKFASQVMKEFWPDMSTDCGGLVLSLAGSVTFVMKSEPPWDWQIVPAVNLPTFIDPKLRVFISCQINRNESKFCSGLTCQVLPGKKVSQ